MPPPVPVCRSVRLSPFYSIPFSCFHYFILGASAAPLVRPATSALTPNPMAVARGRLGAVALLLRSVLGCSTRQRAADFNVLYSCLGPDARFDILSEDELGMSGKRDVEITPFSPWVISKVYCSVENKSLSTTDGKTGSPMGLFGLPLFPTSLAQQERGASEGE